MPIPNYSLSQITERIILNLPTRFVSDASSNVYKFYEALAEGLLISTSQLSELFRQTSLPGASGGYVDKYISLLSDLGRYKAGTVYVDNDETDSNYKERYKSTLYVYNSTKNGLTQIVIDMLGGPPKDMYTGNKTGAYTNARYYYNQGSRATYGNNLNDPFVGYIEFSRRPNDFYIDELRKTIDKCRGYGITIYLKYPSAADDLDISLLDGLLERAELY